MNEKIDFSEAVPCPICEKGNLIQCQHPDVTEMSIELYHRCDECGHDFVVPIDSYKMENARLKKQLKKQSGWLSKLCVKIRTMWLSEG